jgi:hypothetical protein
MEQPILRIGAWNGSVGWSAQPWLGPDFFQAAPKMDYRPPFWASRLELKRAKMKRTTRVQNGIDCFPRRVKVPRAKTLLVADIINSREKNQARPQECGSTETAATEDPKREEEA